MELFATAAGDATGDGDEVAACPWCASTDVDRMAMYGPQMLTDQYHCNSCLNYFGRMLMR